MKKEIRLQDHNEALLLFGRRDENLRKIRESLGVRVVVRDHTLKLSGDEPEVLRAYNLLRDLQRRIRNQEDLSAFTLELPVDDAAAGSGDEPPGFRFPALREVVEPKSAGQVKYLQAIETKGIVLCVGPAGTGKTFLAVAMGVASLRAGTYRKIVMVRPAVEAGEKLGFLPGDFQAKVNPYLKPIYDALGDFFDLGKIEHYLEKEIFEIVPLAFMRGRTLNDSFIILDEAQNTTVSQMKMFLTRMGARSKAVVTGDVTQVDLPPTETSGLVHAVETLGHIEGIAVVEMSRSDIVRHGLVKEIVEAYRRAEAREDEDEPAGDGGGGP